MAARVPKNLGVDPFPDPGGHFGTRQRPFWIFEVLIEGIIESKNLFSESCSGRPITQGLTYFQTPSAISNYSGDEVLQAVRFCRQCSVAGCERVHPFAARLVSIHSFQFEPLELLYLNYFNWVLKLLEIFHYLRYFM